MSESKFERQPWIEGDYSAAAFVVFVFALGNSREVAFEATLFRSR